MSDQRFDHQAAARERVSDDCVRGVVALAAFNGMLIGSLAAMTGAICGDGEMTVVAVLGATTCAVVWQRELIDVP